MAIPFFPDFKPIELEDKGVLEDYLRRHPPLASEYTFTNLFAWKDAYRYALARYGEGLLIRKRTGTEMSLLQPLVPGDALEAVRAGLAYLCANTPQPRLERLGEDFIACLPAEHADFTVAEERDNFDYLYSVQEMIELAGQKFHDKKNLLNQFEKRYHYTYTPLTQELADECLKFQHEWCVEKRCESIEGLDQENCAARLMLRYFDRLGLLGGAMLLDGQLAAYTLGELLNPETLVIHVEKGRSGVTGIYQAINREFLRHIAQHFSFVNREQDLGLEGLRKAKLSYHPVQLIKKYIIRVGDSAFTALSAASSPPLAPG